MYIIAANKIVDGEGDFSAVEQALEVANKIKLKSKEFKIATLDMPWSENLPGDYIRGVDCANPSVDFSGKLIVVSESKVNIFKELGFKPIKIDSCCLETIGEDGPSYIPEIVKYEHLEKVFKNSTKEAEINFKELLKDKKVYLETYTCYPVVPLALLLKSGLVASLEDIPSFLEQNEITITGGLNLNKAPWNNTTLSNMIDMTNKLRHEKDKKHGLIHGNSSLGYQQGIIILSN